MARDQQFLEATDLKNFEKLFLQIESICPNEPPALTHGDLRRVRGDLSLGNGTRRTHSTLSIVLFIGALKFIWNGVSGSGTDHSEEVLLS